MPVHFSPSRSLKYCRITLRTVRESSLSRPASPRSPRFLGCKGDLAFFHVFQLARVRQQPIEELRDRGELQGAVVERVHAGAEHRRVAQALRVPADVLARHAHAALVAIERIE